MASLTRRTRRAPGGVQSPRQARSRDTFDRLLASGAELLAERRFEEATVAELVRRARSSIGAFYARFGSKEALLNELDERLFEAGRASWGEFLAPERWAGVSAGAVVEAVVARLVDRRRERKGLLRALALYVRTQPTSTFARRSARLNHLLARRLGELLLRRKGEVSHPRPARAVLLALAIADSLTRDAMLFGNTGLVPEHLEDSELKKELSRALKLYLGIKED